MPVWGLLKANFSHVTTRISNLKLNIWSHCSWNLPTLAQACSFLRMFLNMPHVRWQLFLWHRLSGQLAWTNLHFWSHLLEWVWGLNRASLSSCSNGYLVSSPHSRWIIWLSCIGLDKCVICHQLKTVPYWLDSSNASLKDGLKHNIASLSPHNEEIIWHSRQGMWYHSTPLFLEKAIN